MKTCDQCTNPFPFVCSQCAADIYAAMAEDAEATGLSTASTGRSSCVAAPTPTGSFMPRDVVQQERPEPPMQQFAKLFVGSGEDAAHCGC